MTGRERMKSAMRRQETDHIATMPQICHPHAITLYYEEYRRGIADIIEHPEKMHELIIKTGLFYDVDGIRLFRPGEAYDIQDDGTTMLVFEKHTQEKIGIVDVLGGGGVRLDQPALPIPSKEDVKKIPHESKQEIMESEGFSILKQSVHKAHQEGFFVASSPPGFTMNYLSDRRGRSQALIDIMDSPVLSGEIMDRGLENSIEHAEALVEAGVDCLYIGDPSSSASLISPDHFREFCLPRFKTFCDKLHRHEDLLIYIHICGNSEPLLEMMEDTGVDCVEPLDPLGGVDIADAKQRIGHRVCLMGGLDTVVLLNETPEKVYEEAFNCCEKGGKTGYILAAGDMVPDFTPPENVKAMVRASREFIK